MIGQHGQNRVHLPARLIGDRVKVGSKLPQRREELSEYKARGEGIDQGYKQLPAVDAHCVNECLFTS